MSGNDSNRPKPLLVGFAGTALTEEERLVFRDADPFGFILFKRNCESPEQLRYLVMELQQATRRREVIIAIDQEGGRVARLQPPHWAKYPPARAFGAMYERDPEWGIEAIKLYTRILSYELVKLGISINCAPVVDLFNSEGSPAIGDRAFSTEPAIVAALARAQVETFLENGILPVVKHMPGHGRMRTDPHLVLPTISASRAELDGQDFVPFELLKDVPIGMNSHAVFSEIDPKNPASLSSIINNDIIRGVLGFDGLLLSDDLTMKALKGKPGDIALKALAAGNDVILQCNGEITETRQVVSVIPAMNDQSWARWIHARGMVKPAEKSYVPTEDAARLDVLLGGLAYGDVA